MTATLPEATATRTAPSVLPVADGIRRLGPAWAKRVGGLHVMKVAGSFHDMGFQHGRLLQDAISEGPIPYYRTYCEKLLKKAGLGPVASLAMGAIRVGVARKIIAAFPPFVQETVRGFAEGSGMSEREAMEAFSMPDTLMWIAANAIKLSRCGPAERHRLAAQLGCSSAIAWGGATADGKLYHARNLDYHGVEPWTRAQAVIFHAPEKGQRFVSVAAAGIPMGGATAMNEAGLTLAVHQHMFTDATSLGGTPIGCVGDIVMREAETLDDAEKILGAFTPIGCWTYLVTDGKRREVLCWEENPRRRTSFRHKAPETTFGYANVYRDAPLAATERDLYGSYWRANHGRDERVRERLREGKGRLDASGMASILADTGAPEDGCRLSRAVAMLLTVGSVVFSPEDGRFWVGTGDTPTSHGRWEPFSLAKEDHAPEAGALATGPDASSDAARAFEAYRRSYVDYFDREDMGAARANMRWAVTLAPREALFHALEGMLAIQALDLAFAKGAFERALALGHRDAERAAEFRLWRGRAHDLKGERALALADYRAALETPHDPPVAKAAKDGVTRAYTARRARRIAIDFAFADVIAP